MSHHQTEETTNKKFNYLLRMALAFVYALALAFFLHLLVGSQQCSHCIKCSACNDCNQAQMIKVEDATLWGEKESGECCKSKDKCAKEHDCKTGEAKEATEEKADAAKEETKEEKK